MKKRVALTVIAMVWLVGFNASAALAEPRAPLGCSGCSLPYGVRDTWFTGCWGKMSGSALPRLEAKVDGRWVVYDSRATPVRGFMHSSEEDVMVDELYCLDPDYPYIMAYTFEVRDEGQMVQSGWYAGLGLLPMREVWKLDGRTQYDYFKVYVS